MSISPAMKHFITAEHFAVIGKVLTDQSRFDNKVLRWYKDRNLPVVGVRPDAGANDTAEGIPVMPQANQLLDLPNTSISVIIHPAVGLPILKSLFPIPPEPTGNEPKGVWFQPGAESDDIKAYVAERKIEDKVVLGGPCILRQGDQLLPERKTGGKL